MKKYALPLFFLALVLPSIAFSSSTLPKPKYDSPWTAGPSGFEAIEKIGFKDMPSVWTSAAGEGELLLTLNIDYFDHDTDLVMTWRLDDTSKPNFTPFDETKKVTLAFPNGVLETFSVKHCPGQEQREGFYCVDKETQTKIFAQFKTQPYGNMIFVDKEGKSFSVPFTLKDFDKAYATILGRQQKQHEPWSIFSEEGNPPVIHTASQVDGKALWLEIASVNNHQGLSLSFDFNKSVDKTKEATITFPDSTKESFLFIPCNDDHPKSCACDHNYCVSQETLEKLINHFKNQPKGTVSFFEEAGKEVSIPFTLEGFNKAFDQLKKNGEK